MSALVWSPVYKVIEGRLKDGDDLCLLIVSFVKLEALKQLLWVAGECKNLKVIVRWRVGDIVNGVSDLSVYEFLREKSIPLYFNNKIHLKLYLFESNVAFNTSGNLTLKGLGYSPNGNIEVGSMVDLVEADWQSIYELIETSTQVDDAIFEQLQATIAEVPKTLAPAALPSWPKFPRKVFTIKAFPAMESLEALVDYYTAGDRSHYGAEDKQRAIHDLVSLKVPQGLSREDARTHCIGEFREIDFVKAFVEELKIQNSMSFGMVSKWVHTKCEDVPLPYRWEIKDSVRRLYDWLSSSDSKITWDVPNYSMVIYWDKQSRSHA